LEPSWSWSKGLLSDALLLASVTVRRDLSPTDVVGGNENPATTRHELSVQRSTRCISKLETELWYGTHKDERVTHIILKKEKAETQLRIDHLCSQPGSR
jgi:hypothetical protein